ncbi:PREDICTED: muellerian-inhibiting factor [Mesitornis unicolor]|uniref:muellerian-inhibiting factor n=1 Tax=Mesitornis unicolor TaxID=54374 RepID=UPI00052903C6|nr:PREDICTED: muellerian-inhibiting factor [Mesitornis unicolor]
MKAAFRVLLPCLVLVLPTAALTRRGSMGERISPKKQLELRPSEELGLEAEERKRENASLQERGRPNSAARPRVTAAARLFAKPEPGAKCMQGIGEDGGIGWPGSSLHPWPLGGLEGPVCRVKMDQDGLTLRHLDVVGVLTQYESAFIKLLRQHTSWDRSSLETFGLCPAGGMGAALHPLKHIQAHVVEPGQDRVLVLHLEQVKWETQAKLWFKLAFQAEVGRSLGELRGAVLLFYRASLPPTETQRLLFGTDDKCFTRMTPVLLLLAQAQREEEEEEEEEVALAQSSYLSADGVVDVAPYPQLSPPLAGTEELPLPTTLNHTNASFSAPGNSSQFLGILTRFIRQVLSPDTEPPTPPSAHHWLDFQLMETLPHQLLNLSEEAALERLVQSEEPSVLLFPQDSGAMLEQHLGDWQPEGTVLQLLMGKLEAVIQELRDIPAFRANTGLFQHLLSFCYFPPGLGEERGVEQPSGLGKLHALLLLKALQTVRVRWQERRKVLRQNRSARHQAHCRLQELTIDLRDRQFIVMPTVYAANNCEGPCKLPLSTRVPGYHSHTVLLLGMQERGSPLQRAPCCVPIRYSDQLIISLSAEGLEVRKFPNMVAEECGCR